MRHASAQSEFMQAARIVAQHFDERDPAVKAMLSMAIAACRKAGKYVGICGQGPSDHPVLARRLVVQGIYSLSLNPDTVIETWLMLAAEAEKAAAASSSSSSSASTA